MLPLHTKKDEEVLAKYDAMPDLPKPDNSSLKYIFALGLLCVSLLIIPVLLTIHVDNVTEAIQDELQEIRTETSCDSLTALRDSLGTFPQTENTIKRYEIKYRLLEMGCS